MTKTRFNFLIFKLFLILKCNSLKIAVLGASSHLGREIIYQGINRQTSILGLTTKHDIYVPYRCNSFNYKPTDDILKSYLLNLENYWVFPYYDYDHLIISVNAKDFERDYTDELIVKFIDNLSPNCQSLSFISKYNTPNLNIFLKDRYLQQEQLINNHLPNHVEKFIYRPSRLSFGTTIINSRSRKNLAKEILDDIYLINYQNKFKDKKIDLRYKKYRIT